MKKIHIGCGKRDFGDDWFHVDGSHEYSHIKHHDIVQKKILNVQRHLLDVKIG